MSSIWRNHFSFNKYSQIAARALRASLKESERVAAEKRGVTTVKYQQWENGQGGEQIWISDKTSAAKNGTT
ncbi:hypothetical protein M422DRAFT_779357 [Sphaerobolus stellatus SS14]|uniref:Mitochondrial ATP synthase epsilon chain domain-containing protein n=1 Tax=Sphaerobolus stellatus (strain SS14) TaxID=990650 RepID=A0A0C9W039_SPHS4|nr:hypothetical protein M422DRAFT_779357 [Sphaerobolus stellatus SS14]